jgi:hypothetical protein
MTQSALQEVAMDGSSVPHFALGSGKAPAKHGRFTLLPISELNPDPRNSRKHSRAQIRATLEASKPSVSMRQF